MSDPPEFVDFTVKDHGPVLVVMRSILERRDGWINIAPTLELEELPEPSNTFQRIFGASGPSIPFGTWVPGGRKKNSVAPTSLGLRHGSGPKAIIRLRECGITVPEGWRVLSDHGRRGLVLSLPDDTDPDAAIDWLLRAAVPLTAIDLPNEWRAQVFRRD